MCFDADWRITVIDSADDLIASRMTNDCRVPEVLACDLMNASKFSSTKNLVPKKHPLQRCLFNEVAVEGLSLLYGLAVI